jgi:hypothetical protein
MSERRRQSKTHKFALRAAARLRSLTCVGVAFLRTRLGWLGWLVWPVGLGRLGRLGRAAAWSPAKRDGGRLGRAPVDAAPGGEALCPEMRRSSR